MKNFLIDICLVGLLVFLINGLFNEYRVQEELFDREISQFEQDIKDKEVVDYNYATPSEDSENLFSLAIKSISDFCIYIIEIIVLLISNFISMLV